MSDGASHTQRAMRFSSKGYYGLRAVFDMAFYQPETVVQVREIARRQGIPVRFLEQILHDLKKVGVVKAKRGPGGGYRLSAAPEDIPLAEVFEALEGGIQVAPEGTASAEGDPVGAHVVDQVFHGLTDALVNALSQISLQDMCKKGQQIQVEKGPLPGYSYSI